MRGRPCEGRHPGFPEPIDPDVVYLDAITGGIYIEKPADIERYTTVFDHVRAAALSPKESSSLLARLLDELRESG